MRSVRPPDSIAIILHNIAAVVATAILSVLVATGCGGTSKRKVRGKIVAKELPPVKPEALREFDAAMRAIRLGGPEANIKARERLERATGIDPNLWEAWHNLGVVLAREGNDRAASAYAKAIKLNPTFLPARIGRAEALHRAGKDKQAEAEYKAVLDEEPEHRAAAARLAGLLRSRKQYEKAIDVLREALRNAGADADIYVELALVYLGQGRDELADLVLKKATALDDKQPAIYNARALLALERGEDQRAFELFDRATSLAPQYADARFNKASVLLDAGDYARAKEELDAVVQIKPDDAQALVALGVAQRGLKQYDRAAATWEGVVKHAQRSSMSRGDALYDLAVLEMDHRQNDKAAIVALDRYLQQSPKSHPKREEAAERKKELGP